MRRKRKLTFTLLVVSIIATITIIIRPNIHASPAKWHVYPSQSNQNVINVTITYPVDEAYLDSLANIWINGTVTAPDKDDLEPYINDSRFTLTFWNTTSGDFAFLNNTALPDGTITVTVSFTDSAGNTGSDTVTFNLDTVMPVVEIAHPTEGQYLNTSTIWINGTVTELNKGNLKPQINNTAFSLVSWDSLTGVFAFSNNTIISDGAITVKVSFTDLAGKTGSAAVHFILDTTNPEVVIIFPKEGSYVSIPAHLWVNGTVTDANIDTLKPFINDTRFTLAYWNAATGIFGFRNNTAISDGKMTIEVGFTDMAGNTGRAIVTFNLDTTSPIVKIVYPKEGAILGVSTVWVNGTVNELNMGNLIPAINDTRFTLAYWNAARGVFGFRNYTAIPDGVIAVKINFTDLAGNVGSDLVTFIFSAKAPIVEITYPIEGSYIAVFPNLWINGTVTEQYKNGLLPSINDTRFELAYWDNVNGAFGFKNKTAITDGSISVCVNFTNMANITGFDTVSFTLDTLAPIVKITSPSNGSYVPLHFRINGTITELNKGNLKPAINDTRFNLTLWNPTTGYFSFTNITALADGPLSLKVNFTDLAGNTGEDEVFFIFDATPPTAPTSFNVFVVEGNATFTWSPSSDNFVVKGYYLELNGERIYVGNVTNYTWPGLTFGSYVAKVWAIDVAGNKGVEATLMFAVAQKARILNIECPSSVYRKQLFPLTVTVENVGNITGIIVVKVSNATATLANTTISLTINQTGAVSFNLTAPTTLGPTNLIVTAGYNSVIDDSRIVPLEVLNIPPVAAFKHKPRYPKVNQTMLFNAAESYDPDGVILTYIWDFGDGSNATLTNSIVQHAYENEGIYNVTLTVVDNDGSTSMLVKEITVYVTPPYIADIAVTSIYKDATYTYRGRTFNITVVVINLGTDTETFNVTLYCNTTQISRFTVVSLPAEETYTIIFSWNTTGFTIGNYSIWAYAEPLPDEMETENNIFVDGWIYVALPGDLNGDRVVDIFDLVIVAIAFGSTPAHPSWNPKADVNNDGIVDIYDLVEVAVNFGKTARSYS